MRFIEASLFLLVFTKLQLNVPKGLKCYNYANLTNDLPNIKTATILRRHQKIKVLTYTSFLMTSRNTHAKFEDYRATGFDATMQQIYRQTDVEPIDQVKTGPRFVWSIKSIVVNDTTGPQHYPDNGLVSGTRGKVSRNQEEVVNDTFGPAIYL
ncbi:hypothetical protein AVEN_59318-1 [Araneus ventricosus]|uniref:Uncharacterized protein n=1 Tax=Araneus ventricosus TaxID=182803 RepID=A0A4Y2QC67_ARAVE|nr:hypothetical protein AVEN_59318-1 [Araneus ventricosus]